MTCLCAPLSGKVGSGLLEGKQLSCLAIPASCRPVPSLHLQWGGQLSAFIKHSHTNQLDSAAANIHKKLQCRKHSFLVGAPFENCGSSPADRESQAEVKPGAEYEICQVCRGLQPSSGSRMSGFPVGIIAPPRLITICNVFPQSNPSSQSLP